MEAIYSVHKVTALCSDVLKKIDSRDLNNILSINQISIIDYQIPSIDLSVHSVNGCYRLGDRKAMQPEKNPLRSGGNPKRFSLETRTNLDQLRRSWQVKLKPKVATKVPRLRPSINLKKTIRFNVEYRIK